MAPHDFSNRTLDERYTLVRLIGYGGMATVYEATDQQLDKRVAVKVLNPELTADADHMARFRQEALSAAMIRHPHLVDVTGQGYTKDGLAYFVMEHLDGESLGDYIHKVAGPLPWTMAVEIVRQVCSALEVAHERGIIHRDIKPANCFLEQRKGTGQVIHVKVLDLGIAKVRREEWKGRSRAPKTRDSQGVPGTPEYMAPELARGQPFDHRVDIYALGVMMYRLLTGDLPFFSASSPYATLEMHCFDKPRPLRELNSQIPQRLEQIVLKALAKAPEERHTTAGELASDLDRVREQETTPLFEEIRTQQYVRAPAIATTARRLIHVSTVFGGFTTAAAMFMILLLFGELGQTAPTQMAKTPLVPAVPNVIIQELSGSPKQEYGEKKEPPREDSGASAGSNSGPKQGAGDGKAKVEEPEVLEISETPKGKVPENVKEEDRKAKTPVTPKGKQSDTRPPETKKPPPPPPLPDKSMVEGVVARAKGTINAGCRNKLSKFQAKVEVAASLTFNAAGKVAQISITPMLSGTNLGNCVDSELRKLAFKPLKGSKLTFGVKVVVQK